VQTCGEVGLPVVIRAGPWCHGEARNGGLPEWLLDKGLKLRTDDPAYLKEVRILYAEIAAQLKGLLWKDGGPVVGFQLENEYRGDGTHLVALKRLARESGIDVPIFTRTGWPELKSPVPYGEILPLFGGYAEGFWDRELTPMPGDYWKVFAFETVRTDTTIATDQFGRRKAADEVDTGRYPYFTCELGGGMISSYHRRLVMAPEDALALALAKVGSGSNLPGYYMYHGGTNPDGARTTLQELQATRITNWNDLPEKGYDYKAPLGEFGQIRLHYHLLRRLHLLLRDFGESLAAMPARLPEAKPAGRDDSATLRWAVRSNGDAGFVFVNNYQRLQPMPAKPGVQFELGLKKGILRLPEAPCTIPADRSFLWPFNLELDGARLAYATAQPVCRVRDGSTSYFVFAETAGVPAEFVFDEAGLTLSGAHGRVERGGGRIRIKDIVPGRGAAADLRTGSGRVVAVLLDEADSLGCWKASWGGRERLFLSNAGLVVDGDRLRLSSDGAPEFSLSVLPAPGAVKADGAQLEGKPDGVFVRFAAPAFRPALPTVPFEQVATAGPARMPAIGVNGVAAGPTAPDFARAAVWRIRLPADLEPGRDLRLRVRYTGDVARAYLGDRLLTDDFFNGEAFEIGLKRSAPEVFRGELLLKVLPMIADAPIGFSPERRSLVHAGIPAAVTSVELVETRILSLTCD